MKSEDNTDIKEIKKALRKEIMARLLALPEEYRKDADTCIIKNLLEL